MLVLHRRVGERVLIGEDIVVTVVKLRQGGVRLGIEAPSELPVVREELVARMAEEPDNQASERRFTGATTHPPAGRSAG